MEHYQVKFEWEGETRFGVVNEFGEEAKKHRKQGKLIVNDAILPVYYVVEESVVTDIPHGNYSPFNPDGGPLTDSEYDKYVFDEMRKAEELSGSLGEGEYVGALFSVGVGDGGAWYVVTKVKGKKCDIEWRGFDIDRYMDHFFGSGKKGLNLKDILPYIRWQKTVD